MALQAIVATFEGIDGADQALGGLQQLDNQGWQHS